MSVHYLEIVTGDVDSACAAWAAAHGVEFSDPEAALGGARTAPLPGGGRVGVRGPMRESEDPVTRPYTLVDDIAAAAEAVEKAGGTVALPPTELPGQGIIAIYIVGGNELGLWQE
jgi:predicted enzyme related to lactoylglutathione lyase